MSERRMAQEPARSGTVSLTVLLVITRWVGSASNRDVDMTNARRHIERSLAEDRRHAKIHGSVLDE